MKIPEGWKLVPLKVTPAMGQAMADARGPHSTSYAAAQWNAALAAAPTPPAQERSTWKTTGDTCLNCGKRIMQHEDQTFCPTAHYEEQPDGTILPVDPADMGLTPPAQQNDWQFEFQIGGRVEKFTGDYKLEGIVVGHAVTIAGHVRYVVEHRPLAPGMLHIYGGNNIRLKVGE